MSPHINIKVSDIPQAFMIALVIVVLHKLPCSPKISPDKMLDFSYAPAGGRAMDPKVFVNRQGQSVPFLLTSHIQMQQQVM